MTEQVRKKNLLADAEARYRDLAMACDRGIIVVVASTMVFANDAAIGMLGATQAEQVIGRPVADFFVLPNGDVEQRGGGAVATYADTTVKRLDEAALSVSMALIPCRYDGQASTQIIMRDISERRKLEGRLQFLVQHDILTELPNRAEFRDRLLARSRARGEPGARSR